MNDPNTPQMHPLGQVGMVPGVPGSMGLNPGAPQQFSQGQGLQQQMHGPSGMFPPNPGGPIHGQQPPVNALDWRGQMQDWRGQRPDRQGFTGSQQDWRGAIQDWRGLRPDRHDFTNSLYGGAAPGVPPAAPPQTTQAFPPQMLPPQMMPPQTIPPQAPQPYPPQVGSQLGVIGATPATGQYGLPGY